MTDYTNVHGVGSKVNISQAYASEFPLTLVNLSGGTVVFTINDFVHRVANRGQDPLGRWSFTTIHGKHNRVIKIIAAYRCIKNYHGALSVWNQQRYLLDLQNCTEDPIDKFVKDLIMLIGQSLDAGEHVVLGIDVNKDVCTGTFQGKMKELGLFDICVHKHGIDAPPTYARGSNPIDALYVSPSLISSWSGYHPVVLDHRVLWMDNICTRFQPHQCIICLTIPDRLTEWFCPVVLDHRVLWMDISLKQVFGTLGPIPSQQPQHLTLQDPRVVAKYTAILSEKLQSHQFAE
jgi:hypothetical protein